jgi:hypothetical protein
MNKIKNNCFVLVTVPHTVCPQQKQKGHPCDYRAPRVALILERILKTNGIPYEIVESTLLRSTVDLNRDLKLDTPNDGKRAWKIFNNKIQTIINNNSDKNVLLLDLHSFDKIDSFCKNGEKDKCFITILDIYNNNRRDKDRREIYEFANVVNQIIRLRHLNFKVYVGRGGTNYIINTYGNVRTDNNKIVYPMLLEFFEDSRLTDEFIVVFFHLLLSDLFISTIFH